MQELRKLREDAMQEAAQVSAQLAGLEERRSGAQAAFERIDRMYAELERRVAHLQQQLASAGAEKQQRAIENTRLEEQQKTSGCLARGSAAAVCAVDRRSGNATRRTGRNRSTS